MRINARGLDYGITVGTKVQCNPDGFCAKGEIFFPSRVTRLKGLVGMASFSDDLSLCEQHEVRNAKSEGDPARG